MWDGGDTEGVMGNRRTANRVGNEGCHIKQFRVGGDEGVVGHRRW
jgi:hypothetical protein